MIRISPSVVGSVGVNQNRVHRVGRFAGVVGVIGVLS
jgi:hypothetical protein